MNAFTKMSDKGQVVIPKDVRDRQRLAPGDRFEVIERPDGVLLRRPAKAAAEGFEEITRRIRSRIHHAGSVVSTDEMSDAIARMWESGGPRWDR